MYCFTTINLPFFELFNDWNYWKMTETCIRRKTARTLLIKDYANSLTNKIVRKQTSWDLQDWRVSMNIKWKFTIEKFLPFHILWQTRLCRKPILSFVEDFGLQNKIGRSLMTSRKSYTFRNPSLPNSCGYW